MITVKKDTIYKLKDRLHKELPGDTYWYMWSLKVNSSDVKKIKTRSNIYDSYK
jgi:hypothetical protein